MRKQLLLSLLFTCVVHAQSEQEALKYFRVLCLGDYPPWEEKVVDGVRTQILPPLGSLPPSPLAVTCRPGEIMSQENRLGIISQPYELSSGLENIVLSQGPVPNGEKWVTVKPPKSRRPLLLCWRKHEAKTWDEAEAKFLPDGLEAFPPRKIRVINTSHIPVTVILNGERAKKYGLGKGAILPLKVGRNTLVVKIPVKKKGKVRTLTDMTLDVAANERVNAIIYKADGVRPRRPAKIWIKKEQAPFGFAKKEPDQPEPQIEAKVEEIPNGFADFPKLFWLIIASFSGILFAAICVMTLTPTVLKRWLYRGKYD